MKRWAAAARYGAYCAGGLLVAATGAVLILPEVLDSPSVREKIQRRLSGAVKGEVAWEALDIRIVPSPRGVLRGARIGIPGVMSARAEQLEVGLRFWPLLRGRAEVVSVNLSRPVILLDIPEAPESRHGKVEDAATEADLAATYRSTLGAIAGIVRRFAPDTTLSVKDGRMEFSAPGILPIALHDVAVRARTDRSGMDLDLSLAGTRWSQVKLAARVQFADLSGHAEIAVTGLKPQPWLDRYLAQSPIRVAIPSGEVRARAHIGANTELDCDFDVRAGFVEFTRLAQRVRIPDLRVRGKVTAGPGEVRIRLDDSHLGAGRLTAGVLRYSVKEGATVMKADFDIDTAQATDNTRRLVPERVRQVLARFEPAGRVQGRVNVALGGPDWRVGVDLGKSAVAVRMRDWPMPVRIEGGTIAVDGHAVTVRRVALAMEAGRIDAAAVRHTYRDGVTAVHASFDLALARTLDAVRGALPAKNRDALAVIRSATGRAQGDARFTIGPGKWSAAMNVLKSNAAVGLRDLPAPVRVAGASVEFDAADLKVTRAALSMLDAQALVSALVNDYRTEHLQATVSVADGVVGEKLLAWVWTLAQAPARLELKAPVRIAAPRVAWSPKRVIDVAASARFDGGPEVSVELGWMPGALDIRRAAIRDGHSDAVITLRTRDRLLEGSFSGTLYGASVAALLRNPQVHTGSASGDLRFTYDRDNPRRTTAEGHLKGESLDLALLIGRPVNIARIDLATDDTTLRIREAAVDWAGQRATIRGQISRSAMGPVIDAQLDSPGIDLDALFPPAGEPAAAEQPGQKRDAGGEASRLWPLPVTGRIAGRSDFFRRGRYTVAPVSASLVLEERRARLDLEQAQLCGISLPLVIEATPKGFTASAQIAARKQQLEQVAHCLTSQGVLITGDFDLKADISSQGRAAELMRNLKGTVTAESRDGKVMKFALLGNILSMQNVAALFEKGGPKLDAAGFPYRTMTVSGHFENGRFFVKESAFRSDAVGLVGAGWVSILDYQSRLSVLVAPFSRVDELVRKVPILGYILGGSLTSVPVGVSGDIRDPLVVPLGPVAITHELLGIFERTLKLPVKLIELPSGGEARPADGK